MHEWIKEVNAVVQGLKGKTNNRETREQVTKDTLKVLNDHKVVARVDCSPSVNTSEVVHYGEFHMVIDTDEISYRFKHIKKEKV